MRTRTPPNDGLWDGSEYRCVGDVQERRIVLSHSLPSIAALRLSPGSNQQVQKLQQFCAQLLRKRMLARCQHLDHRRHTFWGGDLTAVPQACPVGQPRIPSWSQLECQPDVVDAPFHKLQKITNLPGVSIPALCEYRKLVVSVRVPMPQAISLRH